MGTERLMETENKKVGNERSQKIRRVGNVQKIKTDMQTEKKIETEIKERMYWW